MANRTKVVYAVAVVTAILTAVQYQNCARIRNGGASAGGRDSLFGLSVQCSPFSWAPCPGGMKMCNQKGNGYNVCTPSNMLHESDYMCTPGNVLDCSNDSTYGVQTCEPDGRGYASCVIGDCKPGYSRGNGETCEQETN